MAHHLRNTRKGILINEPKDDEDNDCVIVKEVCKSKGKQKILESPFVIVDDDDDSDDDVTIVNATPRKKLHYSFREVGESSGLKKDSNDENYETGGVATFVCDICADTKPKRDAFYIKGCYHYYCNDCVRNYIDSKLEEGVTQINCPVPNCFGGLDPEQCRDILSNDVFVKWGNLLCEATIVASQKYYCPFKDCSALLIDDGSEEVTRSECPSCYRLFCARCRVGWHEGVECATYRRLNKDEREAEGIMLMNLAKGKRWQRCPKCKIFVEKTVGCNVMHCRCGAGFFYCCGQFMCTCHRLNYRVAGLPTLQPYGGVRFPTQQPTDAPRRIRVPLSAAAPLLPTQQPTAATRLPTQQPTAAATRLLTRQPTAAATRLPTRQPTAAATRLPTRQPIAAATRLPTQQPTGAATRLLTRQSIAAATRLPTQQPTVAPLSPTQQPTAAPPFRHFPASWLLQKPL